MRGCPLVVTRDDLPTYSDLMLPTLRAVKALGGSATSREITTQIIDSEGFTDEMLGVLYEGRDRDESILLDRIAWARSYSKLSGALDSPKRGLFLLSETGQEIVDLPDNEARGRVRLLDAEVKARKSARRRALRSDDSSAPVEDDDEPIEDDDEPDDGEWRADLLARLHALPAEGFEEFVIYVLKTYGMELERVGGSGDEGIDGIGTAPVSPVLSSRVAVQAKRYDPDGKAISREVVALFQRDAAAAGAERAVLVTLSRFSEPARKAATQSTPNVELIDGDRLAHLVFEQGIGIVIRPHVDTEWFNRFET